MASRPVIDPSFREPADDPAHSPPQVIRNRSPTTNTDNLYPSSSSAGFFQSPPNLLNQFHDDAALQRALTLFLPDSIRQELAPELSAFGAKVLSPQVLAWVLDAERNAPYVKTFDSWGRRRDELFTSEGWRNLQSLGIAEGMVAIPYENRHAEYSRVHHFAKYALWCGSAAWVNCPSLMVDGVASLFLKHLNTAALPEQERSILTSAYSRLTSRDPQYAWTTGQWMTERQGGSDVSMTETLATYLPDPSLQVKATDGNPLGPWLIDGFKWFSSATDANMMVFLARTPKGISTFFAPMRKTMVERDVLGNETELNGVYIQRLKNKLGTRALPTAELELKGVRAWLVGEEGRGTKEIATVLNIARVHNGVTAIGLWGRGLGIVRAFTRVRIVGRRPLWQRTAFMRTLSRMHTEYRANVLFNLFVAALQGVVEQHPLADYQGSERAGGMGRVPGLQSRNMADLLLRLLTPTLKGHCSKTAIAGLQECMESMGGVGYLENEDQQFNIARLYRDANVLPIWEGTTDMMADDSVLRVLYGKTRNEALEAFETWLNGVLSVLSSSHARSIRAWWNELRMMLHSASKEEAEMQARAVMIKLVDIVQGTLLLVDHASDGEETARLVADEWFEAKTSGGRLGSQKDWQGKATRDLRIVFGEGGPEGVAKPRL